MINKIVVLLILMLLGMAKVNAQNWDTISLKDWNKGAYNDIVFATANHGFIIGDSNLFIATMDAGRTWIERTPIDDFTNPNRKRNKDFKQMLFLNDTLGFMRSSYELFQSKDAGKSWKSILNGTGGVLQMNIFNNTLSVFSDEAFGTLLTSVYSVEHDTFTYVGGGFFPIYSLEKVIRLNDSIKIVGKDSGKLFIYHHPNRELSKVYDPSVDGLVNLKVLDLFFINEDTGFASFNYILLKKTTDGGKTWFTDSTFNNSSVISTSKVFSWANDNLYLSSVNFQGTNFIHKFNRDLSIWEDEATFINKTGGFGHSNFAGIAGNGEGLFSVFEGDILGYKTKWNLIKSLKHNTKAKFKVYPNPSNGKLYILQLKSTANRQFKIYNVQGKLTKVVDLDEGQTELKFDRNGIYFLRLEKDGITIGHQKVIIQSL